MYTRIRSTHGNTYMHYIIQVRDKMFQKFDRFLNDLEADGILSQHQREHLHDHICGYDELAVCPDGVTRGRKLSTRKLQKMNFRNAQKVHGL